MSDQIIILKCEVGHTQEVTFLDMTKEAAENFLALYNGACFICGRKITQSGITSRHPNLFSRTIR